MKNNYKLLKVGLIVLSFLLLAASNPGLGLRVESADLRAFPIVSLRLSAWNTEGCLCATSSSRIFSSAKMVGQSSRR